MAKSLNGRLFNRAKQSLVGGVDSPVRAFAYVGREPVLIARGRGSKIYDYDGNSYIDYVLSWGSLLLGHSHPAVTGDIKDVVGRGLSFGATNRIEIEMAELIKGAIGFVDKIRFVNSGTEAVMGALRLARGHTARPKILKFENSYHGSADYLLAKGGSGLSTLNIPLSAGVPGNLLKDTLVVGAGDTGLLSETFKRDGSRIAAVIVEPVGGNYGVIPPDITFLKALRALTKKYGILLVFDEVITGFRFGFKSAAQIFGITPDIICFGKIIGGGLPIGAFAAKDGIMSRLAPSGDVYQASTFSGNPVSMRSGLSTLETLKRSKRGYGRLAALARRLAEGLEREAALAGIDLKVTRYENIFSLKFPDKKKFGIFYRAMLERGVYFAPSEFEANFLSFAHTDADIAKTIKAAAASLKEI